MSRPSSCTVPSWCPTSLHESLAVNTLSKLNDIRGHYYPVTTLCCKVKLNSSKRPNNTSAKCPSSMHSGISLFPMYTEYYHGNIRESRCVMYESLNTQSTTTGILGVTTVVLCVLLVLRSKHCHVKLVKYSTRSWVECRSSLRTIRLSPP